MTKNNSFDVDTICIHGAHKNNEPGSPVREPIVLSNIYHLPKDEEPNWSGVGHGIYTRNGSDNQFSLEAKMAAIENAQDCALFASGVAALSAVFWTFLPTGSHVICSKVCYAAVNKLFGGMLTERYKIEADFVDTTNINEIKNHIKENTKLIHVETPGNPTTGISDISEISKLAKAHNILLSVDGTFASPIYQKPLDLGADISIHSMTKYINGHGDAMGGCVCSTKEIIEKIKLGAMINTGGIISPFNAWIIDRGLMTLPLRMEKHSNNAMEIAEFLQNQNNVTFVYYPGLESHPQHKLALKQMSGFSGMLCFGIKGDDIKQKVFLNKLSLITYALSLGDTDTLIVHTSKNDAKIKNYPSEFQNGFFRMSVGLESSNDIISDLKYSLYNYL